VPERTAAGCRRVLLLGPLGFAEAMLETLHALLGFEYGLLEA
jgi:hypothetical protein